MKTNWCLGGSVCLLIVLLLSSCSHEPTSREKIQSVRDSAQIRPGAAGMDEFWLDFRSPPDRPVEHWEFYYKHCSLISRKPWLDEAEYMCTDPH